MPEPTRELTKRIGTIEEKLDALAVLVTRGFERMDQRFQQVDDRFQQVDERFEQVDQRFQQVDLRFQEVDLRFRQVDEAFAEQRSYTEFANDRLDKKWDARFQRLERKLDQFIDSHSRGR